ncbi:hypothetical protein AVEN_170351-1 [Araneus ventricosus]|uniref:Uncharacterized protein n=1 Tax=Araneus ventricosus TaxID=182803 RepID=A0A4Y2CAF3_ARAVE|nr:hypothetical protein AVEN_170351-1 [Araneus ventricosus]
MRMILLCLIPIWAERCRVPFIGLLVIVTSICVDVPSSVSVFGLPHLLSSTMEPVLFEFLQKCCHSVMGYLRSVRCIASTPYLTSGTSPSRHDITPPHTPGTYNLKVYLNSWVDGYNYFHRRALRSLSNVLPRTTLNSPLPPTE